MNINPLVGRRARQPIAIEIILNPQDAMNRIKETRSWLVGVALLLCLFLIGSFLQRGAVHNIEATYQQLSYQQDTRGLSVAQQQAAVEGVRHAPLLHDLPNWLFAFTFIVAAISLAWGFALLITSLGRRRAARFDNLGGAH